VAQVAPCAPVMLPGLDKGCNPNHMGNYSDYKRNELVRVHIKPFHLISEYSDSCLLTIIIISLERSIPSCVSIFNVSLNTDVDILSRQPGLPTTMNVMRRALMGGVSLVTYILLDAPIHLMCWNTSDASSFETST